MLLEGNVSLAQMKLSNNTEGNAVLPQTVTGDAIQNFIKINNVSRENSVLQYATSPSLTSPYSAGKLTADSGLSNISRMGHRRWILKPSLRKIVFGYVENFTALHVCEDDGRTGTGIVAWPAEQMPVEYFNGGVWTLSTGNEEDIQAVTVALTRNSDNRTWKFGYSVDQKNGNSGYFNVENSGYAERGCIIFQPAKKSSTYSSTSTDSKPYTYTYTTSTDNKKYKNKIRVY